MFLALMLAAASAVVVPFTILANHLVIPVTIDGKPAHALFDTGGGNSVDRQFADRLVLKVTSRGRAAGAGEATVPSAETRVRTLQFGSIVMHDQSFTILPLARSLTNGNDVQVDAIVGREILHRYVARIDYDAQTIAFTPSGEFKYEGSGESIPLENRHGAAVVRASIEGLGGTFQIDTGSSASLILTSPFVQAHGLRALDRPVGNMIVGRGVGGYTRADIAAGKRFRIGNVVLDDVLVELSSDRRGAFASRYIDGNIGNDVLRRMTLTLDEPHHVAYLERNSRTDVPTPPNRAGLYAQNDDRDFFAVADVLADGPAYQAGLRTGDRIVAIDGTPSAGVTADDFWNLLHGPPGKTLSFTVDRDGKTRAVSVTLRN
ncbi:MAG: aspartyl protease family protein, partial [Vulcanimicrobiaceae bacterium]